VPALSAGALYAGHAVRAQLQQIAVGLVNYSVNNKATYPVVNLPFAPGVTTTNTTGEAAAPLEGWVSIRTRDGYVKGRDNTSTTPSSTAPTPSTSKA